MILLCVNVCGFYIISIHCTRQSYRVKTPLCSFHLVLFTYSTILQHYLLYTNSSHQPPTTLLNRRLFFPFLLNLFPPNTLTVLEALTYFLPVKRRRKRAPNSERESSTSHFLKFWWINQWKNSLIPIQSIKQTSWERKCKLRTFSRIRLKFNWTHSLHFHFWLISSLYREVQSEKDSCFRLGAKVLITWKFPKTGGVTTSLFSTVSLNFFLFLKSNEFKRRLDIFFF